MTNVRRMFFELSIALIVCNLLSAPVAKAQAVKAPALMPLPTHLSLTDGAGTTAGDFAIDGQFDVKFEGYQEPRLLRARQRFLETLTRQTGIFFGQQAPDHPVFLVVKTAGPGAKIQQLGEDESYELRVSKDAASLTAPNPLGVMHGLQTFMQLVHTMPNGFNVPAVTIIDKPRFPWRGLMIDSGRHFMPIPVIERNLDGMEAVKLNVFHWHLSENQGFRMESKVFPLLHEKGSDGLYYTQEQVRHVIEYARDRGIRVIPEFDMPGHTTAWFVGYPELASGSGPYQIERRWGVFDPAMDPTRESTYQFLAKFIGEMTALFPDTYFHIGGDECNGKEWDANPRIQKFMADHKLRDDAALQAYFTSRVQKLVASRHKVMEGWDEVLQPDTPQDVVIQSWRGRDSLLDAAKRGYKVLLSNGYYIDLNQSAAEHYRVDPLEGISDQLRPEQAANILGGEATMWSEFVTPENIDSRIWPRTAAIAERLWSPQEVTDLDSMYARLAIISRQFASYGLAYQATYEAMLRRMNPDSGTAPLEVLASVVEPPKGYARGDMREYQSYTPLNRLVDAVPPESETARKFDSICKRIASGNATGDDWKQARDWLILWRDNDSKLQATLANSNLTEELIPISKSLAQTAEIGLLALEHLQNRQPIAQLAHQQDVDTLKTAEKPQAVLVLKIVSSVELLVNAVRTQ